ncbi:MAG: YjgN family protein [Psychrobium sp.]
MDVIDTPQNPPENLEPAPVTPPPAPPYRKVPVVFGGDAKEFFGIWIVNVLLTIVTLGIYSAWAKVRTQQYFYGNLKIEGHAFSYLAQPLQILKGRILAVILFAVYTLTLQFYPVWGLGVAFAMLFLIPWLINQSLRFNLRMSSYRNVRFSFQGTYGEAFIYFVLLPVASVFTLYLMLPFAFKKMDEYIHNNIRYGDKKLNANLKSGEYYVTSLLVFALSFGMIIAMGIMMAMFGGMGALVGVESEAATTGMGMLMMVAMMGMYILMISLCSAVYRGRIRNHILNNCEFDGLAQPRSDVDIWSYVKLIFVNVLAVALTFGFAYPWVKVRTTRFLSQATMVLIDNEADGAIDEMVESQSAFGEEAAEVFDVDIALT